MDSPPEHGRRRPHVKNLWAVASATAHFTGVFMIKVYEKILEELKDFQGILAIDGRCGSGKTELGRFLQQNLGCNLLHMDDFYLPLSQREEGWQQTPGKNMDFQRLIRQVLEPAARGEAISYAPYDCGKGDYGEAVSLPPRPLTILEGSYSQTPILRPYYGKMYFLTCSPQVQRRRLQSREGEKFPSFQRLWIPLEEKYLALYPPVGTIVDTGELF